MPTRLIPTGEPIPRSQNDRRDILVSEKGRGAPHPLFQFYNPRMALEVRSVGGDQGAGETGGIVVGGVIRGGSVAGGSTTGFRYEIKAELAIGTLTVSHVGSVGAREE